MDLLCVLGDINLLKGPLLVQLQLSDRWPRNIIKHSLARGRICSWINLCNLLQSLRQRNIPKHHISQPVRGSSPEKLSLVINKRGYCYCDNQLYLCLHVIYYCSLLVWPLAKCNFALFFFFLDDWGFWMPPVQVRFLYFRSKLFETSFKRYLQVLGWNSGVLGDYLLHHMGCSTAKPSLFIDCCFNKNQMFAFLNILKKPTTSVGCTWVFMWVYLSHLLASCESRLTTTMMKMYNSKLWVIIIGIKSFNGMRKNPMGHL